jgi:hypothetical protein
MVSETLTTTLIYGLILVGILNNFAIMGWYAYGVVKVVRRMRGAK